MKDILMSLVLVLISATAVSAQEVTGHIDGRVLAQNDAPLDQVVITVSSANLIGRRSTSSDSHGRFFIHALPVGSYRLELRLVGFRPVVIDGVSIRLGETTSLPEIRLRPIAVQLPEVIVGADAVGLDPNNTAQKTVLTANQLDALPLERNFRETMLLAPSAIPSFLGRDGGGAGINRDGINVGGATGYENTYFVDGINITSPIRGETSIDLPYNFIEQIKIGTDGSTAEDAQAHGGVVDIVTPSGSDRLRNQIFGFFSNDQLEARAKSSLGSYTTGFTFYDVGASVSGPLIRDRLRFFGALNENLERREYTYAFGTLPSVKRQHLFAAKLTWQLTSRTSGFVTILGDPGHSEPLALPLFGSGIPQNEEVLRRKDETGGIGISARFQHSFARNVMMEGSVSQMTRDESGMPATAAGNSPIVIDYVNGTLSGGHGFGYNFDSRRRTGKLDLSWQLASHALKLGTQIEQLYGDITIDIARGSTGGTIERVDASTYTWHSNLQQNGRGTNLNPAVYIQDSWQVSQQLSLNAGLRWSRQLLRDAGSKSIFDRIRIHDGVQPRIGVVYHPGMPGTQRIFASYSRTAEQLPVWGFQDFANGAESLMVFTHDPRVDPSQGDLAYAGANGIGTPSDNGLRGQTLDSWSLGYNRRVRNVSLSAVATRREIDRVVAYGTDTAGGAIWGNPGHGAMSHLPRMTRRYDAVEVTGEHSRSGNAWMRFSYVLSRTRGNYPGLFGSDWRLGFSNFGPMFISPEQYVNSTGLLPNDRTHVFKAFGARQLARKVNAGASLLIASGTPLTEYGAISIPPPFRGFASQRGTAGRTPTIWDLGVRASYELPVYRKSTLRTRVLLDIQHIGNPRKPVDFEQLHFNCLDSDGHQSCVNGSYGRVLQYQSPMVARLGVVLDFRERR